MPREKTPTTPKTPTIRKRATRNVGGETAITGKTTLTFTRFVKAEQRAALIAEAAFLRAEQRGFAPGHELEDWLAAESEVDGKLLRSAESGALG